jgi:xanthine dehydrogenase accessory factor
MRDVLDTLERWRAGGLAVATATVVATERSAPRPPGATLAVCETGEVAGSVTGGCVEPAVIAEARAVLAGGEPRLLAYGIADEEAFEVGLPCGGTVHVFVDRFDPDLLPEIHAAVAEERPLALAVHVAGARAGEKRLVAAGADRDAVERTASRLLAAARTGLADTESGRVFVLAFAPRPRMYVFGAVDFSAALARLGRFLGYRVTVCDAREAFLTRERIPDADELVLAWPDELLRQAPVDARTAICVLTHDHKFDLPALEAALATDAGYIGAMGSRRMTAERADRLRERGVTEDQLQRIHAPIGLRIGSRSPEEVAVAIGAEIIAARAAAAAPAERSEAA